MVNYSERTSVAQGKATRQIPPPLFIFLLLCFACGAGGCADYYAAQPGYGRGYYASSPGYAPGPGYVSPGYGYPGSISVEIGDRPYYTRGAGYYVGRSYYVWRPGHWTRRHGRRFWIHGHYAVR